MTPAPRQDTVVPASPSLDPEVSPNKFLTFPNLLSLLRVALIIPFVLVMLSPIPSARIYGVVLLGLAALTDKYDGVLARKYNQATEWGRILDPLADKVGIAALVAVLLYLDSLPLWFAVTIFARDILILLGGIYLKARRHVVLPSNEAGKWTVGVITITLFLFLVDFRSVITTAFVAVTCLMLLFSLLLYVRQFLKTMKNSH